MTDSLLRLKAALADRYTIEREIGSGGMAAVYLAHDLKHNRKVAVKVLRPELAAVLGGDRFLKEIEVTANLQHPNILPLFDSGEADGFLYYVMPHVEGESLRDKINREKQLPVDETVTITTAIANALEYAHGQGVIHRDIKPENILLQHGQAVVADFGIALAVTTAGGERLTETGLSLGTPEYMSPEQASGDRQLDARSDVYSLAAVVYEMLTGEPPHTGPTAQAIIAKRLADPVPSVRVVRDTIAPSLDAALIKALAKVPADRFRTASTFATSLATSEAPVPDKHAAGWSIARSRAWRALAALALTLGVAFAIWQLTSGDDLALSSDAGVSSTGIAVFPATVPGDDSLHLREGLAELLYRALDGAGGLRGVDPNALYPALRRADVTTVGLDQAPALAAQLDATLYVLSRVVALGDSVRVRSSLYDLARGPDALVDADAAGAHEELTAIVEDVARQIIFGLSGDSAARLADVSGVRTNNFAALKAYMEGQGYLRVPDYPSAIAAFDRAVMDDSSFSLAWYQRAATMTFLQVSRGPQVIEETMQHSAELGSRERRMLQAEYAHDVQLDAQEALRLARELIRSYPNHVEALRLAGTIRIWNNWRVGRPLSEARQPLQRALELDPDHQGARFFLAWVALVEERFDELHALMRPWAEGPAPTILGALTRVDSPFRYSESDVQRQIIDSLAHAPDGWLNTIASSWVHPLAARRAAELLTDSTERDERARAIGFLHLAHQDVGEGRWESAKESLAHAARLAPDRALAFGALLAVTPFLTIPDAELAALRDSVTVWNGELGPRLGNRQSDIPDELAPYMREYLLGLLHARLGDDAEAQAHARALEEVVPPEECSRLLGDLALEIHAAAAAMRGDEEAGLTALERMDLRVCAQAQYFTPINNRPYGRLLRADLLQRLGRDEEALGWLSGFGWLQGTEDALYKPYAHLLLGQIYERLGATDQARYHYATFVERWQGADPPQQPLVEMARQRMTALTRNER